MTRRTRLLTLDVGRTDFRFHAGQAVRLGRAGYSGRRAYSIASAPSDLRRTGVLEFLVGLEEGGASGAHLAEVGAGSQIEVEGPFGGFDLPWPVTGAAVLLVAGGTGIAPLRSMWRELFAQPACSAVSVIHSARSPQDLAFLEELRDLEQQRRIRLWATITGPDRDWRGHRGRLTERVLTDHLPRPAGTRCAVCGPDTFVGHVRLILRRLGVPPSHIATERW